MVADEGEEIPDGETEVVREEAGLRQDILLPFDEPADAEETIVVDPPADVDAPTNVSDEPLSEENETVEVREVKDGFSVPVSGACAASVTPDCEILKLRGSRSSRGVTLL